MPNWEDLSYYNDHRVRAQDERDHRERPGAFTLEDEDGAEHELPTRWVVCPTCDGHGSHVNPSIDAHGISAEDFAEDPEFFDEYRAGTYDVPCYGCGGRTTIQAVDEDACDPELLRRWHAVLEDREAFARECAAERRMGA